MTDLNQRIEQLSPEKRALLIARLRQKGQQTVGEPTIRPRADQGTYPLSFAQQRMWIVNQMEPDSPFYNITVALRLAGPLDVAILERSLREVMRRHEVLGTSFTTVRGAPVQVFAAEPSLTLSIRSIEEVEAELAAAGIAVDREEALRALGISEARQVFDLSQRPLLRACLVRLDAKDHLALLNMHHIIADGWSMGVLIREIALLYEAFAAGRPSPLPELRLQYADFAAWQREWLSSSADGDKSPRQRELEYWREQLRGAPPRLELPTDRPRPAVQTSHGATYRFCLPRQVEVGLQDLARQENATLYMALLAAYNVLLYRCSGQDDISVGTPVAYRNYPEIEDLIGFFVNTIVIRSDLSADPSFRQMVRQVRDTVLAAQSNQDLPFELLVEELQPHRDLSTTPLFQVMFDLDNRPMKGFKLPGLNLSPFEVHSRTAKFDLTLFMVETEEGLAGTFEYNTDLWDEATIARMATHFENLLTAMVTNPELPVSRLPMLTPAERQQIVVEWNQTATDYPADRSLKELFEAQVQRTPENIAVIYGERRLSYQELNERANRLAHRLRRLGIGPDTLVGVFMERSLDMMLAFLGIIKAGGAYLPLDSDHPAERLSYMLEDGRVPVLLSQQSMFDDLPRHAAQVLLMDADWPDIAQGPGHDPPNQATADNLAYVIYTSGSTGQPKGVSIPQRAVARLVLNTNYVQINEEDCIAQASNASFDAATFEIWGSWLHGCRLVGIPKEVALSAQKFAAYLKEQGVTILFITTALLNYVASEAPDAFSTLKTLKFGGEAVDPRWVRQVLMGGRPERFLHVYGPTESTTYASWYPIDEVPANAKTISIGKPLANTTIYVLDRHFQPTPVGVAGQLCIGGDGLARDYRNQPALTAAKYMPDPFSSRPGARMYLTGDLVRYLDDGNIEFMGRIDQQIKIRGFRIELGEVEAVLGRHPSISAVLVRAIAPEGSSQISAERRLVAYVVPRAGASPSGSELRRFLKETLPDYMVPSAFVMMEAFPLNPNGKIDHRALPLPDQERPDLEREYAPPRTALERFLVEKWQEVLGISQVGIYDNFFELGGNSLQAAVLVNRLQEEMGETAHIRALFMAPTVADLALYIAEYYPEAAAKIDSAVDQVNGGAYAFQQELDLRQAGSTVTPAKLAHLRSLIPPLHRPEITDAEAEGKNPPAIFILSPPRSGSTLLRVMMAGNPQLFSPPELDLLSFDTLQERQAAFSGKYSFWLEGPIRAIMEIQNCSSDEAVAIMQELESRNFSTKAFYRRMQQWIGDRLLVDKTPVYSLDPAILRRMETDFDQARYIHLTRHPYATTLSFVEARLDELFFRHPHPFTIRELGELVWIASHQNILAFLRDIPQERKMTVRFEDLVTTPQMIVREICSFLQIDFHSGMLKPYEGKKMTTGVRPGLQMVGDFKFYLRNKIDASAADRWKKFSAGDLLSDVAWEVGDALGYQKPIDLDESRQPRETSSWRPLVKVDRNQPLPLSFAQQRLWFLEQWETGSAYYNVPAAVRLKGALNQKAMERSLQEIVQRHEVLCTGFVTVDGKPNQLITDEVQLTLEMVDLRNLPTADREVTAQRLAQEEARQPFDLTQPPLLRARLLRLADDEYLALITMHHIVSDGWSVQVFIRELAALYEAYSQVKPGDDAEIISPLPPLPVQYADYAYWQRRWLDTEMSRRRPDQVERRPAHGDGADPARAVLESSQDNGASALQRQLDYWRQQLAGAPSVLELPTDRPRPAVQTLRGARFNFSLPEGLTQGVRALSRREGTTLFITLLAAFQALLSRYSGQEDLCVGTPIAGRNRAELEPLIGFFVNTLVLRADLSGRPGFRELLQRVKGAAVDAYANQDVPFEMLVDELEAKRDMSHTPLFQVMFSLQEAPMRSLRLPGLTLTPLQSDSGTSKFDLTLSIVDRGDSLIGALEYNSDLFNEATIERMIGHFQTLLEGIIAQPDSPVSDLHLLTPAERQQLLVEWNDTAAAYPDYEIIGQRFEAQAARTPAATAVIYQDDQLTFDQLNRRANQLAHHLRNLGVGSDNAGDSLVGLALPRSTDLIVGILGILKAGGAYLPLDPSYPADRIDFMLRDSGARIVVTQQQVWTQVTGGGIEGERLAFAQDGSDGPHWLFLDADWPLIATRPDTNPVGAITPDHLAYVIYTSGSTGRPKGVMIAHRSALNLAASLQRTMYEPYGRPMRISLNAPVSFDASVQQIVMLTYGHALVIIPDEDRGDANAMLTTLRQQQLDQLDCVPTQLKFLLDAGLLDEDQWTPSLVFPGGEAIDAVTWQRLAQAPATDFFNVYGPTECTVDCAAASARLNPGRPTIGGPLGNVRLYVLDRYLQPLPVGVPGELYIGGVGVARGYLNRPDLTAERFIPNPFATLADRLPVTGERLYKTGDLVRWLPDGNLEFLGRIDHQVKLRGFRIELGEIEATLRSHPSIHEAVVVARDDLAEAAAGQRLVAYLVAAQGNHMPTVGELRRFLSNYLPEYMTPSLFVAMEALPLTPNRKIDRQALPEPDQTRPDLDSHYAAPTTPSEQMLSAIWSQVLGLPQVGVHDNFFELGGDSILSIQVIARANQAGMRLTPKQLFQAPTIAQLARLVGTAQKVQAEQGPVTGPVPLTPLQRHFFQRELFDRNHWNQSLLLQVRQPLDLDYLQTVVAALTEHHDALRLRFRPSSEGWQQDNAAPDGHASLRIVQLDSLTPAEQSEAIERVAAETQASLDIQLGPLFQVVYFDLGPAMAARLLLVAHHLVIDGISWRVLLEDLQTAYKQLTEGRPVQLPLKTSSFKAWAERLVSYARSDALRSELPYWLALVDGEATSLPQDFPGGHNTEASTAHVELALAAEETQSLLRDVPAALGAEINDVLLAAMMQAMAPWTGSPSLLLAMEGHGREDLFEDLDISRTVGWFTSLYPLRLDLGDATAPAAALKRVQEQLRQAPQRGIGYGLLRYLSDDPAAASLASPALQPQISFNYLGQFELTTSAFGRAPESAGPERSPDNQREYLLDLSASIVGGRLRLTWHYSSAVYRSSTIEGLAQEHLAALQAIIALARSELVAGNGRLATTDADLSQDEMDALLAEIG